MADYQYEKANYQWLRYVYMRDNGHLDFVEKADKCENFFAGLQWSEEDLAKLRRVKRPALTINKVISTLSTVFGEQIFNRSEIIYRPKPGAPEQVADALTKVWQHESDNNQLVWTRSDVFADGSIRSRGFYDVRIVFDDNLRGELRIRKENSRNVLINPDAEEYDPDTWGDVVVSKWFSPIEIERLYGKDAADELRARGGSAFEWGWDSMDTNRNRFGKPVEVRPRDGRERDDNERYIRVVDRQYDDMVPTKLFVDPIHGDTRPVPENWERDRVAAVREKYQLEVIERVQKRIRWCTTADDLVLHDDLSPYRHFTLVPYFPYFRGGRTIGLVENLIGPQELLNKSTSQELHVVNTTANSGWKIKSGSLQNMTIEEVESEGAKTGLVLELNDVNDAEKIQPNAIPQGLERLSYKAEEHMKSISNVSDSMQGFDREDVAAKAIVAKTQRGSVNFASVTDNLERSDFFLARAALDLMQSFYTEPRVFRITHDNLSQDTEDVYVNQVNEATGAIVNDLTVGEYTVVVSSSPHRATMEDSQFAQAKELRELGIQLPDEVLIENSRLYRRREVLARMQKAKDTPEARKLAELQLRKIEAEVMELEANAKDKLASAEKKLAEARAMGAEQDPGAMERYKVDKDVELKRELGHKALDQKHEIARKQMMTKRVDELAQAGTPTH